MRTPTANLSTLDRLRLRSLLYRDLAQALRPPLSAAAPVGNPATAVADGLEETLEALGATPSIRAAADRFLHEMSEVTDEWAMGELITLTRGTPLAYMNEAEYEGNPFNMTNKSGEIVGLEVDLVTALAESMGLEVAFVTMPFADLLEALETNKVDMVASGMTITPERNARVAFAGPYFITGKSVLTKSETLASVTSASELDNPEFKEVDY